MDERIEKAFDVANYMATLSNQRRIMLEEFNQQLIYYINGATFVISPELLTFTKLMIDSGYTHEVAFVDINMLPVIIGDVQEFYNTISQQYFESLNVYATKYASLSTKRKIQDIIEL
jgi:hypothetical protein